MVLAVVVLLIGVPLGLYLLLRPRHAWWTFEAWRYRHPTANEPSEAGYGMQALGGVGCIACAVILAWLAWTTERDQKQTAARQQADETRQQAIDSYVPPPPEDRGLLPVIGYTDAPTPNGRQAYELYYLSPPGSFEAGIKQFRGPGREGWFDCLTYVGPDQQTEPVTIGARLSWEPGAPPDDGESERCTVDGLAASGDIESESFSLPAPTELATASAIVDPSGRVIVAAKPGNRVPRLDTAPTR